MTRSVHIVDSEACTSVGLTAASSAAAVRAGISRLAEHPFMVDDTGEPLKSAVVPVLEPTMLGMQRLAALAQVPIGRLAQRLSLHQERDLLVFVALPEHRPGWTPADERTLMSRLTASVASAVCPKARLQVAGRGHAAALVALDRAAAAIQGGLAPLAMVLSVDSYFEADTIDWLLEEQQLITEQTRSAFAPGEAAAVLLLMEDRLRCSLRLPAGAVVCGSAVAEEPAPLRGDQESFGVGMIAAVEQAAARLRLPEQAVGTTYLDLNGERYRSEEWGFVALRSWRVFRDPAAYIAPADCWGDVGAASGALFAILADRAWARGYARGAHALLCAGSEAGTRAAVVLARGAS